MSYLKLIDASEDLLRNGQVSKALQNLKKIPLSKISTNDAVRVARLARRTGQISAGIKVLQRQISRKQGIDKHGIEFKAEYANLLTLFGCVTEALDVLEEVDLRSPPEALLAKAWCYFETWDYSQALPLLKKYVRVQPDKYLQIAGYINLAEALLGVGDLTAAIEIATKSINEAKKFSFLRLQANALHIRARALEESDKISASNKDLTEALNLFGDANTNDSFLIRRQVAINKSFITKKATDLLKAKVEAASLAEYESLRICDYKHLQLKFSNELFNQLYIGSPYPKFRSRLVREFPQAKLKKKFVLGNTEGTILDLSGKDITYDGKSLNITSQMLRLLLTLIQDSYNPVRIGTIYASSFPGSRFVADHSPMVVHQALKRLREWLIENEIPLEVDCTKRRYTLKPSDSVAVVVSLSSFSELEALTIGQKLSNAFAIDTEFSLMEAAEVLQLSKASTHRALVAELMSGNIEKRYQGRSTKYVIRAAG